MNSDERWWANREVERRRENEAAEIERLARENRVSPRQMRRLMGIMHMGFGAEDQLEALEAAQKDPNW